MFLSLPTEPPNLCIDQKDATLEFMNESPRVIGSILIVELRVGAAYSSLSCTIGDKSQDCKLYIADIMYVPIVGSVST